MNSKAGPEVLKNRKQFSASACIRISGLSS